MSDTDKDLFPFDMVNFDWDSYYYNYMRGVRVYILNDPLDTVLKASGKYLKYKILHYMFMSCLVVLLYKFLMTYN